MKYGVKIYNNGIEEMLSPCESSVFLKKMRITPGITQLFKRSAESTPLVFIRASNYTGGSINGLCDVTVVNDFWSVNLRGPAGMPFDIFIFVKSSYHLSLYPKKWGVRIYNDGVLAYVSSQTPLRILTGKKFSAGSVDTGVPCAAIISTLGNVGLMDDQGGKTVRVTACGAGSKIVWNAMIVSGQMSTTSITDSFFYIDTREYN